MSVDLRVDWCDHKAAKYAVEHWHYSHSLPAAPVKLGIWENDSFIGAVLFSLGSNKYIGSEYGLSHGYVAELTRVALAIHQTPVTRILSISIGMLKKQSPGLRLIVSYADEDQDHVGAIYQAGNWVYVGKYAEEQGISIRGKVTHRRSINSRYPTSSIAWIKRNLDSNAFVVIGKGKHKYLYPLDRAMRKQIEPLRKPYPKRETCGPSVEGDTPSQTESSVRSAGAALNSEITVSDG